MCLNARAREGEKALCDACACTYDMEHVWRSDDNTVGSVVFFYPHMAPRYIFGVSCLLIKYTTKKSHWY